MRSLDSSHQPTRDQEPVARPWPVNYVEVNFHIQTESSEISVYYEEKGSVWTEAWEGSERMLCPRSSLSHIYAGIVSGSPLTNYLALSSSESVIGYLSALPCLCTHLLAKMMLLLSHVQLCNPMDCCTPGFPVLDNLPELAQTHVHRVSDAIQPSHPRSSSSPPVFSLSQHQGLF